jgi:hypothetical protein
MAVHLLIALGVAAAWVLSLLVRPFGRCWLCGGGESWCAVAATAPACALRARA